MRKVVSKKSLDKDDGGKTVPENSAMRAKKVQVQAPPVDKQKVQKSKAEDSEKRPERGR
jgi:hypothetical protein